MVAASATSSAESSADLEPATATKHPTDPKVPRLIIAAFSLTESDQRYRGQMLNGRLYLLYFSPS